MRPVDRSAQGGGSGDKTRRPLLLAVRPTDTRPHTPTPAPQPVVCSDAHTPDYHSTVAIGGYEKAGKRRGCHPTPHAAQAAPRAAASSSSLRALPPGNGTGQAAHPSPFLFYPGSPRPRCRRGQPLPSPAPRSKTRWIFVFFPFRPPSPHLHPTTCPDGSRPTSGRRRPHRAYNARRVTGRNLA